jgi:alpha-tubulin suppressor-like RCC1 family protein
MRSNGTVVAWGHNVFHQCDVPLQLERVVNIFASDYSSMALKSNGSVVQWGFVSERGEAASQQADSPQPV